MNLCEKYRLFDCNDRLAFLGKNDFEMYSCLPVFFALRQTASFQCKIIINH